MSIFRELRESSWNTVHFARQAGKKASEDPKNNPVLLELDGIMNGYKEAGASIEKDGAAHRRVGWTLHLPQWKKDAVLYVNYYAGSFNTDMNADAYVAAKVQYWPRYMKGGKMPTLGKKVWLDVKNLKADVDKAVEEFSQFQDKI